MDTPRKPLCPKIVATMLLLAVLYPLNVGPWVYLKRRFRPEGFVLSVGDTAIEKPSIALMKVLPEAAGARYFRYVLWWWRLADQD